ncbi:hypothetical protein P7K49_008724 [Saguinus oedipus]|uniref:Uncharacterized protein n=1 Tax=Saguinus oedipus TaxID=9490 RepID=A0ABQ9W0V8_SAGOE|nr:hypothetical protein P7K49_008724 [Saguinus oedipus]
MQTDGARTPPASPVGLPTLTGRRGRTACPAGSALSGRRSVPHTAVRTASSAPIPAPGRRLFSSPPGLLQRQPPSTRAPPRCAPPTRPGFGRQLGGDARAGPAGTRTLPSDPRSDVAGILPSDSRGARSFVEEMGQPSLNPR